jgi:hypothetical protein
MPSHSTKRSKEAALHLSICLIGMFLLIFALRAHIYWFRSDTRYRSEPQLSGRDGVPMTLGLLDGRPSPPQVPIRFRRKVLNR